MTKSELRAQTPELEKRRNSLEVVERFISEWERYVQRFILQHRLDRDQRARAYACLHKAQERARQMLSRARERYEVLLKRHEAGELDRGAFQEAFLELRQPVDHLFPEQLKPCLERLLTRAQQAAFEKYKQEWEAKTGQPYVDWGAQAIHCGLPIESQPARLR